MGIQLLKRGTAPQLFGPCLLYPNGWMDQDAVGTDVDLGLGHIVLDGDPAPLKGAQQPPLFGPCLLSPNGRPSQLLLSTCPYCRESNRRFSFSSVHSRTASRDCRLNLLHVLILFNVKHHLLNERRTWLIASRFIFVTNHFVPCCWHHGNVAVGLCKWDWRISSDALMGPSPAVASGAYVYLSELSK